MRIVPVISDFAPIVSDNDDFYDFTSMADDNDDVLLDL